VERSARSRRIGARQRAQSRRRAACRSRIGRQRVRGRVITRVRLWREPGLFNLRARLVLLVIRGGPPGLDRPAGPGVMCASGHDGNRSMTIRRRRTVRNLGLLAAACAMGCWAVSFTPIPGGPGLPQLLLACGASFLTAGLTVSLLWAATRGTRAGTAYLLGAAGLFSSLAVPEPLIRGGATVLLALAGILIVSEIGRDIQVDEERIACFRRFPIPRRSAVRWSGVESVTLDAVVILVQGSGPDHVQRETRLTVHGGGQQVDCNTARWALSQEVVRDVVARSRAAAERWTLEQFDRNGRVRLGSLELRRDGMAWSRVWARRTREWTSPVLHLVGCVLFPYVWIPFLAGRALVRHAKGWEEGGYRDASLTIDPGAGALAIRCGSERRWLPLRRVANAAFLPELLGRMTGAGGPATQSRSA